MTARMDRRLFLASASAGLAISPALAAMETTSRPALARIIIDNDFAGDPDGLFQLAHHIFCRSLKFPMIIGSHLPATFSSGHDARDSADMARALLAIIRPDGIPDPVAGSETPIKSRKSWTPSAASAAIVREAMRTDATEPLIYAAGAGLTDLALAWLSEPRIGRRLRLIWIGGNSHRGLGNPDASFKEPEFNFSIDRIAAQVIFNESDIEIWQVPSKSYRQMLFSTAELQELGGVGRLGAFLIARIDAVPEMLSKIPGVPPVSPTQAYVLGDSPLVTLTALVPPIAPDPTSSVYTLLPTPLLMDDGSYAVNPAGRTMRVYTRIDAGLTFRDMEARFRLAAASHR